MSFFRVHANPAPDPNLFRLTDLDFGIFLHEGRLNLELSRKPKIVRVQKGDVVPSRKADAQVTRRCDPTARLGDKTQMITVLFQPLSRAVGRTVVHHDDLIGLRALVENGFDRLLNHRPAIEGRDDDAYPRLHE